VAEFNARHETNFTPTKKGNIVYDVLRQLVLLKRET